MECVGQGNLFSEIMLVSTWASANSIAEVAYSNSLFLMPGSYTSLEGCGVAVSAVTDVGMEGSGRIVRVPQPVKLYCGQHPLAARGHTFAAFCCVSELFRNTILWATAVGVIDVCVSAAATWQAERALHLAQLVHVNVQRCLPE